MDTELVLVGGMTRGGVAEVVDLLLTEPGTVVLHHDLTEVTAGVVRRRLRVSGWGPDLTDGGEPGGGDSRGDGGPVAYGCAEQRDGGRGYLRTDHTAVLALAHGCVSCTLREDVLPLIRALAGRPGLRRIVLHLDPEIGRASCRERVSCCV